MSHLLLACLITTTATAQSSGPCQGAPYRAFDFWLGEWNVTTPDGKQAGRNRITAIQNGCVLMEEWQGAGGSTGQSFNYYNPATEQWHQLWISPGTIIDYAGNLTPDGTMRLEGTITYHADGRTTDFIGEWTPQADGSVRQAFQEWDAQTLSWQPWFTGIYRKVQ